MDKQMEQMLLDILTKLDKLDDKINTLGKLNVKDDNKVTNIPNEVSNTRYQQNVDNIKELASIVGFGNKASEFLNSVLSYKYGTVTEKQYTVLRDIADQNEYDKPLIIR